MNFDESVSEFSDVILIVGKQKFYIIKKFLALHSTYFNALLLGNFSESQKSEIVLKDIDAKDFQNFLDLIHGETLVEDTTVDGILKLADMYDSKTAIRRCENFLTKISQKSTTEKFNLAVKYNLESLKNLTLPLLQTADDIESVIPKNLQDFDVSIWNELLLKALNLPRNRYY